MSTLIIILEILKYKLVEQLLLNYLELFADIIQHLNHFWEINWEIFKKSKEKISKLSVPFYL